MSERDAWDEFVVPAADPWAGFNPVVKPAPLPDLPLSQRIVGGLDDAARAASNAATFGMADRVAGGMDALTGRAPSYSAGTDAQVRQSQAARERSPWLSAAGDVTGIVGSSIAAGPARVAPAIADALGGGALARALGYGLGGAATGAAQGAGNTYTGNPADYARNATMGGVLGLASGAGTGAAFAPRPRVSGAKTPSYGELGAEADAKYAAVRANPTAYSANAVANMAGDAERHLYDEGYGPRYSGQTWDTFNMLHGYPPGAVVTPANLDYARKQLNRIPFSDISATDRSSGRILKDRIDDFIANPPPGAVLPSSPPGAAAEASRQLQAARGNYAASKRGEVMDDIKVAAQDAAASANSGLNVENVIRQKVKNLINPLSAGYEGKMAGFTPAEEDMLRQSIVRRGPTANIARAVGNMMGGGGGIGAPLVGLAAGAGAGGTIGHYFADDPSTGAAAGFAVPAIGMGIRMASNRSAANAIARATDTILQRSPLYMERAATAPMVPGPSMLSATNTGRVRDALALEMLRQQQ